MRRDHPLFVIVFGFVIAQSLPLYVIVFVLLFLHYYKTSKPLFWSIVVGFTLFQTAEKGSLLDEHIKAKQDSTKYLLRVANLPRRPAVGSVLQHVQVLATIDHISKKQIALKKINSSTIIKCRATDLPWVKASHLEHGDLFIASIDINSCKLRAIHLIKSERAQSYKVADAIKQYIESAWKQREATGLFMSLSLGFRDMLSEDTENFFKLLGLSHLLVLSGFQISIFYLFVFGICNWVFSKSIYLIRKIPIRLLASICGVMGALALVWITGFESSGTRAGMFSLLSTVALAKEYKISFCNAILTTLFLSLMLWPGCLSDLSVQLTYAALLGIVLAKSYDGLKISIIKSIFKTQLWIWVTTTVILLPKIKLLSIVSIPLNIILATPLSFLAVNVGLTSLVFSTIPGAFTKIPLSYVIELLWSVVEFLKSVIDPEKFVFRFDIFTAYILQICLIGAVLLRATHCIKKHFYLRYGIR
jgi:ComEC/Rec2-related protein